MKDLFPSHNRWEGTRSIGVDIDGKGVRFDGCNVQELEKIHGIGLQGQTKSVMSLGVVGIEVVDTCVDVISQGGTKEKE